MNTVIARIGAECEKLPTNFPARREFDDGDPTCADRPTGFEVSGRRAGGGEAVGVVIAPPAVIEELAKAGKFDGSARALWRRPKKSYGRFHAIPPAT